MKATICISLLLATALLQGGEPGLVDRPVTVGRFGNPQAIRFEGAVSFSQDELRAALVRSSAFVLVSHPNAPFEEFLETTRRCVSLGYRAAGFASPGVEADWNGKDGSLVLRIDDGRFLYIIHVPLKRRMGKPKPFDEVAKEVRHWAIMDRAAKRLREKADIVRIDLPAEGETYEEPEPESAAAEKARDLLGKAMGGAKEQAAEAGERKAMLRLAHLYFTGQGVARDEMQAQRWRKAAAMKN